MSAAFPVDEDRARDLLQRSAGGCQISYETLYRMLSRRVFAFLCRSIDNPEVARELMMDTMLEVWSSAARFRGDAKVSTWVLGIARNKLLMTFRSRKERSYEDVDELSETLEDTERSVVDIIASQQANIHLGQCLQRLSNAHRECLHLLYFEELSVADMAQLLDIPEGTVKSRLSHARTQLQRCMQRTLRTGTSVIEKKA